MPEARRPLRLLYGATIALSAFLLFLVQPLLARAILPGFGGSAAVWATCMLFFQLGLLAGYLYSDLLVRHLGPRLQTRIHLALVLLSLAWLPIGPGALAGEWHPVSPDAPVGRILWLLVATAAGPYLVLATTAPLVQAWFNRSFRQAAVYRLYAVSNLASLAALAAYPTALEPWLGVAGQSSLWSAAYLVFAGLVAACAWFGVRAGQTPTSGIPTPSAPPSAPPSDPPSDPRSDPKSALHSHPNPEDRESPRSSAIRLAVDMRTQLGWLGLAALGSVLLLAVTAQLTQNVASVPFLWVLPLGLYLLSFILAFGADPGKASLGLGSLGRGLALMFAILMLAGLTWAPQGLDPPRRTVMALEWAVPLYGLGLFACCLFLHGELARRKPPAALLTRFYLMLAVGGATGGVTVALLAPLLLDAYWELPLALVAVVLVAAWGTGGWARIRALTLLACALALAIDHGWHLGRDVIERSRNFYGTLRVQLVHAEDPLLARRRLLHGAILHGEQFERPQWRSLPTTYYGISSGVGRTLETLLGDDRQASRGPLRVGVIGLGVGTLAAYGRPGDTWRFYEINPQVLDLAQRHFSYLRDSEARIEHVLGDARIMLAREASQGFDLLVIDAFSSDAIPVHLITREALQVYQRQVSAQGALAFHVSNRYLELAGVVAQLGREAGLTALRIVDEPGDDHYLYRSEWIILTADPRLVEALRALGATEPRLRSAPAWTDDHHNLLSVLK